MWYIKKAFGWIFLFIGCVEFGSLPLVAAYHYLAEDLWLLKVRGGTVI